MTARSAGAIGIVAVDGGAAEGDAALPPGVQPRSGGTPPIGRPVLADLAGVDTGLAICLPGGAAWLMPHGGVAVMAELERALVAAGGRRADGPAARAAWPEATDAWEAAALELVASAASPLAVDLLLDQPRRWRERRGDRPTAGDAGRDRRLDRLLTPPLVVIAGPPNVGKSSLTNRLAGRTVSIAADAPGTTRDAPEVRLDLAGLVVRWMDLPGLRPTADPLERAAIDAAEPWLNAADLVIAAADASSAWPALDRVPDLRAGLRADRGPCPGADLLVTHRDPATDLALARAVRDQLIPPDDLASDAPWDAAGRFGRFH